MPLSTFCPENYSVLLSHKQASLQNLLAPYYQGEFDVFASPEQHFRMRAEFRFWHEEENGFYVMFAKDENKTLVKLDNFPIASNIINDLMPKLRQAILASTRLKERLFQIEFLSTLSGQCLVTLIYHKPLCEQWQQEAKQLEQTLHCHIIGRSKKQKIVLSQDFVTEQLTVLGKNYSYHQAEGSFTQPNAAINQKMISWAITCLEPVQNGDYLELYCGNGNFTLPLSPYFNKALATEISKTSVNSAQINLAANQIHNTQIARLSSEEFTQALNKEREFTRLKQADICLDDYQFSTVLVDPPRAGLDAGTLALISQFETILYISCNPNTLANNLAVLTKTHQVTKAALFDQFPYTEHIEAGILLKKR